MIGLYKAPIIFCFITVFLLLSIGLIFINYEKNKAYKANLNELFLERNADCIHSYILHENLFNGDSSKIKHLGLFSKNIFITILNKKGKLLYSSNKLQNKNENYLLKNEVQKSLFLGVGSEIRKVNSNKEYIYFAKNFQKYIVCLSIPVNFLDNRIINTVDIFMLFSLIFSLIIGWLLFLSNKYRLDFIKSLRKIIYGIKNDKEYLNNIFVKDSELEEIEFDLLALFEKNKNTQIDVIKEKMILHFRNSEKGHAFFNSDFKNIYYNPKFLMYINQILDFNVEDINLIFVYQPFFDIRRSLLKNGNPVFTYNYKLPKGNMFIKYRKYNDNSFEIKIIGS